MTKITFNRSNHLFAVQLGTGLKHFQVVLCVHCENKELSGLLSMWVVLQKTQPYFFSLIDRFDCSCEALCQSKEPIYVPDGDKSLLIPVAALIMDMLTLQ